MPSTARDIFWPGSFRARPLHYCRRCRSWWREGLYKQHLRSAKHRAAIRRARARK